MQFFSYVAWEKFAHKNGYDGRFTDSEGKLTFAVVLQKAEF